MWTVSDKLTVAGTFEKKTSVGTCARNDSLEFTLYCLCGPYVGVQRVNHTLKNIKTRKKGGNLIHSKEPVLSCIEHQISFFISFLSSNAYIDIFSIFTGQFMLASELFQFPGHLRGVRVEIFCVSIKCYFSVKNPFFFHIFEIPIT